MKMCIKLTCFCLRGRPPAASDNTPKTNDLLFGVVAPNENETTVLAKTFLQRIYPFPHSIFAMLIIPLTETVASVFHQIILTACRYALDQKVFVLLDAIKRLREILKTCANLYGTS